MAITSSPLPPRDHCGRDHRRQHLGLVACHSLADDRCLVHRLGKRLQRYHGRGAQRRQQHERRHHQLIAPRTRTILFVFIFFYLLLVAGRSLALWPL